MSKLLKDYVYLYEKFVDLSRELREIKKNKNNNLIKSSKNENYEKKIEELNEINNQKIEELNKIHNQKIEELNEINNQKIEELNEIYDEEKKQLNEINNQKIEELKKLHNKKIEEINELNKKNIEELKKQLNEKDLMLDNLKKEHNKKLEEIKNKLEEEYQTKLNNEKQKLSKDLTIKIEEQLRPQIIAEITPKIEKEMILKLQNENNKKVEFEETSYYDFVLQIDNIKNFLKGFKYYTSKNFIPYFYDPNNMLNTKKFDEAPIKKSFFKIGIIGDVKVGKTFFLSKIIKKNIDDNFEGYNKLIKSLKLKLFKENYLFIEGIGFNMSYSYIGNETNKEEKILIGQLNELFIKHYIYNVCDLIIIIVEELNQSELERLYNLKYFFKGKRLIIVHNMKKLNKKEFMNYSEEISKVEFKVEKTKIMNLEGKNVDNYIYLENLRDEDKDNIEKTFFIKENKNNDNNNRIENQEIIHLFIGNDNIDEIKKINEEIFSYIIKQIETNFIQNINPNEKFCFEKILKSTLNSFSKNYLLIKHIHTKGNDYSVNSLNAIGKKEKNNIGLDIIKEENLIKYVIKSTGKDKVSVIPKNININFYTGGSILKDTLNIDNVTMYFDDNNFHIIFYKQSFMETEKIKSTIQIKENVFEDSNEFITYILKIEGEIKKITKYDEEDKIFQTKFRDTEFKINDINKYKRFEIKMRLQHKSDKVINENAEPEIKEINDKKLIDISYELYSNNDIENNSMTDVDEEEYNLSNSEED